MTKTLSRRDFLKLASLLPAATILPPALSAAAETDLPNIIVLVFDAWSSKNVSLYGYPRKTTPYLDRLAEKAIVYHNHYAAGHFTTPGTAGLLTGTLPWRHNLYNRDHQITPFYRGNNLFSIFPEYKRLGYSHNILADEVMRHMIRSMDSLKPWQDLYLWENPVQNLFYQDNDISSVGWIRTMDTTESGLANSLFLSRIFSFLVTRANERHQAMFPAGLPSWGKIYQFILEDAIDWFANFVNSEEEPFLAYFHLLPPHAPYKTRSDFHNHFENDGFSLEEKPEHVLSDGISHSENMKNLREYDEYILYVDAEINRLFELVESADQMENTWIILTSDHGETFERGLNQHGKPSFFDPLVKVPLVIFPPGQNERIDIYQPTSAVDILPTLGRIAGKVNPDWTEGEVLPPFNQDYPPDRPIYVLNSKYYQDGQPLEHASLMLRKGKYKLIYHFGKIGYYKPLQGEPLFELYDLERDPEELDNRYEKETEIANAMRDELFAKMKQMGVK